MGFVVQLKDNLRYGFLPCYFFKRLGRYCAKINYATSVISQINPVGYTWRKKEFPDNNFDSRKHYGIIARELEEVLPELVDTDNEGFKGREIKNTIKRSK